MVGNHLLTSTGKIKKTSVPEFIICGFKTEHKDGMEDNVIYEKD